MFFNNKQSVLRCISKHHNTPRDFPKVSVLSTLRKLPVDNQ